jgi:hypothetical protein
VRVTGHVEVDRGTSLTEMQLYYRSTQARSGLWVRGGDRRETSFDWEIPDLRASQSLCFQLSDGAQGRWILELRCGAPLDQPVALHLRAPPTLEAPPKGSPLTADTTFSWSRTPDAIHALDLTPSRLPTPYHPHVTLYTAATSAKWPDTRALGIPFPKGAATYKVRVVARGPYRTVDEAAGKEGMAALLPALLWDSESKQTRFDMWAVAADPSCHFEYGSVIVCGDPAPGDVEGRREHYMLAPINNSLRQYPELAAAVGLQCVRDCAAARVYAKAYDAYEKSHPGFDTNAPMEERPPPPPPPPIP